MAKAKIELISEDWRSVADLIPTLIKLANKKKYYFKLIEANQNVDEYVIAYSTAPFTQEQAEKVYYFEE